MPFHRPRRITMTTMNPKTATAMLGYPRDEGLLCEMTNQTGSKFPSDEERRQKIAAERKLAALPSVDFLPRPPAMQSQAIAAAVTVPAAGTLTQRDAHLPPRPRSELSQSEALKADTRALLLRAEAAERGHLQLSKQHASLSIAKANAKLDLLLGLGVSQLAGSAPSAPPEFGERARELVGLYQQALEDCQALERECAVHTKFVYARDSDGEEIQNEVDDSEDSNGEDASGGEILSGAPGSINERLQTLKEDPSDAQIQTFQQRAWSSKEFQIALHERVGEIVKENSVIGEEDEKTLYHLIHQRDPYIIRTIIEIRDDDEETSTENLKKLKVVLTKPVVVVGVKPFLSARLPFKRASRKKSAHILQVPGKEEEDICNVQLVRYFVENVWKLERPDVIISVTGGACKNFELRPEYNEKLMRGMMEDTQKLKTWFITGGTNAGIMKAMGEARAKYNPSASLIGVTSLHGIAGGLQLRKMLQETENKDVNPAVLEGSPTLKEISERCISLTEDKSYAQWAWALTLQVCCLTDTSGGKNPALHGLKLPTYERNDQGNQRKFQQALSGAWIEFSSEKGSVMSYEDLVDMDESAVKKDIPLLDPNHSHFILVDKPEWNDPNGFGADRLFRAAFESAVVGAEVQKRLRKKLHGMDVRGGRGHASHNIADHEAPIHEAPVKWKKVGSVTGSDCLKWKEVGSDQPSTGTEIKNVHLAATLLKNVSEKKVEFKQEEWDAFLIKEISSDSYIKAGCHTGVRYFKLTIADHEAPIPVVSVCVQGGPGTVDTVLKACQSGTPALLVRGSGQAADLLADAVRLQFPPSHNAYVSWLNFDTKQDAFWKFLKRCGVDPHEYRDGSVETDRYDWGKAIKYIDSHRTDQDLLENAKDLVMTTYKIFAREEGPEECLTMCLTIIEKILRVALTKKGWVFDLQSTEPGTDDFRLELLKCLLNGISPVGEEPSAEVLWQKLKLSMIWSCDDIIDYLLERISKRIKEEEQLGILDKALLFALKKHNVHALNSLIHRGTGMQMLDVGNGFCYVKYYEEVLKNQERAPDVTPTGVESPAEKGTNFMDRDRQTYFDAASKWTKLIDQSKKQNPSFVVLWENYTKIRKVEKNLRSASSQEDPKKIMEMYEKDCWQAAHPIPESLRLKVYKYYSDEKLDILKKLKEETKDCKVKPFPSLQKKEEMVTNTMNLLLLEGLYVDLCGPAFRYRMGVLGDQWFDMFFWYVLQNDKDLACVMWTHVKYPVRSAICAAYLLRQMAKNTNIDPIDREKMLENSKYFGKKATEVQRAAENDDEHRELAAQSLDCDLFLWRGISLMDLAVQGDCESFLETESFKRCVHRRLHGDLDPGNHTLWLQFKLICSTLTFGLPPTFFPGFLKWAPPPRSEGVRHSTQRRIIPKGYPDRPSDNPTLRKLTSAKDKKSRNDPELLSANNVEDKVAFLLKKQRDKKMDLTSHELETLWAPTFVWYQRWGCFLSSPYVVFLLNCFVTFGVTLFFTVWFIWMRLQPSSFPDMHNNMTGHEIFLNLYFVGCLIREISQCLVSILKCQGIYKGFKDYFNDAWNVPEMSGLISFFVGFWWRFACTQSGGCEPAFSSKDNSIWFSFSLKYSTIETYNLFYALSLFFNWIRVLRCLCLTPLGVTIGIFFSMLTDVCTWLLLYGILLVAISMLFVGTSSVESLVPGYETCSNGTDLSGDDLPENGYIACSFAYVLIRPMLQSFGEFSLTEMTNLYSFAFLLITYFFLNLVLMNLLIATMSSTYNSVSAKAEKWKLLYEYELVQEHARRAIAYPAPINLVLLLLDLILITFHSQTRKNLRKNYPDYTWGQSVERFLARNTFIGKDSRVRGATHSSQDHDDDGKTQAAISALMARAQRTVMNNEHSKDSVEDRLEHAKEKLDSISKDAKCMQSMQTASNRGSTRARMLDKKNFV